MKRSKKRMLGIAATVMTAAVLGSTLAVNAAPSNDESLNLDVVFVLDASGSMLSSDPNRIATDAFNLFVDLCDSSCGVGYDVYTQEIIESMQITDIKDDNTLKNIRNKISKIRYVDGGGTDIALGLTEALHIFDKKNDSSAKRAIILLSDGNSDLSGGPRTDKEAQKEMKETLSTLSKKSIPVYSIGLNCDGTLNTNELKNISDTTSGKIYEASKSEQLTGIVSDIFSDMYGIQSEKYTLKDKKLDFKVTRSGLSHIDFVLEGKINTGELDIEFTDPAGNSLTPYNSDRVTVSKSNNYALIKLKQPEKGDWSISVKGADIGTTVKRMDHFSIKVNQAVSKSATVGASSPITATLTDDKGNLLTDKELLESTTVVTTAVSENGHVTRITLESDGTGKFIGEFTPKNKGAYTLTTEASSDNFKKQSDSTTIYAAPVAQPQSSAEVSVNNDPPEEFMSLFLTIVIAAASVAVVIVIIVVLVKVAKKNKKNRPTPPPSAPKPQPKPQEKTPRDTRPVDKFKNNKKAVDPDLVDYEKIEHDSLENLIKRGPDDAFNKNADDIESNAELEKLIKKGPENSFSGTADDYQIDPNLANLIRTGGDGLGVGKAEEEPEPENNEENYE